MMALQFDTSASQADKRQWILNLGQDGHGAEHWLYNARDRKEKIQFGEWNGDQLREVDIFGARTIATTYDEASKVYALYLDGKFILSKALHLDIYANHMHMGDRGVETSDINLRGCVEGVDVYRKVLHPVQVKAASERLLNSVGGGMRDEEFCASQCKAAGFCCNDPSVGSNQMISCAQACMMRRRGSTWEEMDSSQGGLCKRQGDSGCGLQVRGHDYTFCSECQDLTNSAKCHWGVADRSACDHGARLGDRLQHRSANGTSQQSMPSLRGLPLGAEHFM